MANLLAQGVNPECEWDNTDVHNNIDWKMVVDSSMSIQQRISGGSWIQRQEWTQDTLAIQNSGGSALELQDGSSNGFKLVYDTTNGLLVRRIVSGTPTTLATFTGSLATVHTDTEIEGELTIGDTTPQINFVPSSGAEFRIRNYYGTGTHFDITDSGDRQFLRLTAGNSQLGVYKNISGTTTRQLEIDPQDGNDDCHVEVGLSDDTRGKVHILRDQTNDQERQAVLVLQDQGGTDWYIWVAYDSQTSQNRLYMDNSDPGTTAIPASAIPIGP